MGTEHLTKLAGISLEKALARPFSQETLVSWLKSTLESRRYTRIEAIRASKLNSTFGYQIIAGSRHASRDKLLQLAFGLELSPEEASHMLVLGGHAPLMADNRRDTVIAWCLANGRGLEETDDILWNHGESTVADR